jgi:hypothetical protein
MRKYSHITALAAALALAVTAAPASAKLVFDGGGAGTMAGMDMAGMDMSSAAAAAPKAELASVRHTNGVSLAAVKRATRKFKHLSVAKHAGYARLTDLQGISCIANPGVGAMGVHYVKGALVGDGKINARTPEALVYEPRHGRLQLVAVEYVVFQADWDASHTSPPNLFGHDFMLQTAPNRFGLPAFYMLHAWIYKHNPAGKFEPWNPRVHCPA